MKYIAKSCWRYENIREKFLKGADGIEIQLLDPNKEECLKDDYVIPDEFKKFNIVCIHTPLVTDDNFEIDTPDGRYWLGKAVILAEKIIEYTNQPMNIVCHLQQSLEMLKQFKIYDQMFNFMYNLAIEHPNITFNIENVTNIYNILDNVRLVKAINLNNVKTTLDVCHAKMIEYMTNQLTNNGTLNHCLFKPVTLEDTFEANKDVCNWIHLNNASDTGDGYGCKTGHGSIFRIENEQEMNELKEIFELYEKYTPNATICLEVREDDFLNCMGFYKTLEACKYFKK